MGRCGGEAQFGRRVGEGEVTAMAQAMVEKGNEAGGGQRPAGRGGQRNGEPGDDPGGDDAWNGGKLFVVRGAEDGFELALAQAFAGGGSDHGRAEGSMRDMSRQERRKEERAKANDRT